MLSGEWPKPAEPGTLVHVPVVGLLEKFPKQLARRAVGGTRLLRRASPRVFGEIAGEREGEGLRGNRKAKVRTEGAVRRRGAGAFR